MSYWFAIESVLKNFFNHLFFFLKKISQGRICYVCKKCSDRYTYGKPVKGKATVSMSLGFAWIQPVYYSNRGFGLNSDQWGIEHSFEVCLVLFFIDMSFFDALNVKGCEIDSKGYETNF